LSRRYIDQLRASPADASDDNTTNLLAAAAAAAVGVQLSLPITEWS